MLKLRDLNGSICCLSLMLTVLVGCGDSNANSGDDSLDGGRDASSAQNIVDPAKVDANRKGKLDPDPDPDDIPCEGDATKAERCETCGTRTFTRTCDMLTGMWSEWTGGDCENKVKDGCEPGSKRENISCGKCGKRTDTCNNSCQWDNGGCGGEGVCSPGQKESGRDSYGSCGGGTIGKERTCENNCAWGGWQNAGAPMCGGSPQVKDCDPGTGNSGDGQEWCQVSSCSWTGNCACKNGGSVVGGTCCTGINYNGSCCTKSPNGAACPHGGTCCSGSCVDGSCSSVSPTNTCGGTRACVGRKCGGDFCGGNADCCSNNCSAGQCVGD